MESTKMSTDRCIDQNGKYTPWNIIQPGKDKLLSYAAIQLEQEDIVLNEIDQTQKNKYHMFTTFLVEANKVDHTGAESRTEVNKE